jgi:hypothetical protein
MIMSGHITTDGLTTSASTPAAIHARELRAERATAKKLAKSLTKIPLETRKQDDKTLKKMLREQTKLVERNAKKALRDEKRLAKEEAEEAALDAKPIRSDIDAMSNDLTPAGHHGPLVSGGFGPAKIEVVSEARRAAEAANGSRRVTPEGGGQRFGQRDFNDDGAALGVLDKNDNSPVPLASRKFQVRLGGDDSTRSILESLCGEFAEGVLENSAVFEIVPDSDLIRCVLCEFQSDWWRTMCNHFENSVESEETALTTCRKKGLKAILGVHASLFRQTRAANRKHARDVGKVVRAARAKSDGLSG